MEIWIPKKDEIEHKLRQMADKIKASKTIAEIEPFLEDGLADLDCHVTNRANVERGVINEN